MPSAHRVPSPSLRTAPRHRPTSLPAMLALLAALLLGAPGVAVADGSSDAAVSPQTDVRPSVPGGAVLGGRITLRGGAPAHHATVAVSWTGADGDASSGYRTTGADADGRWRYDVYPGEVAQATSGFQVTAASTDGLGEQWPDRPFGWRGAPPATVRLAPDEVRDDVSLALPPRLTTGAYDVYGTWQPGSEEFDADGYPRIIQPAGAPRYYSPDPVRPAGATSPQVALTPVSSRVLGLGSPDQEPFTVTGTNPQFVAVIRNDGGDDLIIRSVAFEGRDAALYSCERIDSHPCGALVVPAGSSRDLFVRLDSSVYRDVYRATLVVATNAADGVRRDDLAVPNLLPAGVAPGAGPLRLPPGASAALTKAAKAAAAGAAAAAAKGKAALSRSLRVSRTLVAFRFARAGTARIRIDRRETVPRSRTRGVRRWRTVRDVRLRATRGRTVQRKVHRLAAGTYRLRIRATVGGKVQTATLTRTVRR